jgi:hypothetical protein
MYTLIFIIIFSHSIQLPLKDSKAFGDKNFLREFENTSTGKA